MGSSCDNQFTSKDYVDHKLLLFDLTFVFGFDLDVFLNCLQENSVSLPKLFCGNESLNLHVMLYYQLRDQIQKCMAIVRYSKIVLHVSIKVMCFAL